MATLFAKTRLTSLSTQTLRQALVEAEGDVLLQSHYNVAGSLEEKLGKINGAYNRFRKDPANNALRWSYILGVSDDTVVVYSTDWDSDMPQYWRIGYTMTDDEVTFASTVTPVEAAIVITELGMTSDGMNNGGVSLGQSNTQTMKNDAVLTVPDSDIEGITGGNAAETSADNPSVGDPTETAANSTTRVNPTGNPEGTGDGVGNEDLAGTGGSENADPTAVAAALAKDAHGLKQTATLLQSVSRDMVRKMSLGCITQSASKVVEGKKHLTLTAIVTRANIINSQNQVYPNAVWAKNIPGMNDLAQAGKFLGRVEHQDEQGLTNTALKFEKFWMQGDDVYADITVVPTIPDGLNLQAQIEAGVQVDFSTVGPGTLKQGKWAGQTVDIVQDDFVCTRVDAVHFGSSFGSTTTDVRYQSGQAPEPAPEADLTQNMKTPTTDADALVQAQAAKHNLANAKESLLAQGRASLTAIGVAALEKHMQSVTDNAGFQKAYDEFLPMLLQHFAKPEVAPEALAQSVAHSPQFYTQLSKEERAPQTPMQLLDRLVQDMPDKWAHGGNTFGSNVQSNHALKSPKAALKQVMINIAKTKEYGFNGEHAIMSLLALEQGHVEVAQNFLTQSLGVGGVSAGLNADPGGAPLSTPMIFPLVRRVYPQYIMNEIASIQPMDRPDGKIFYLDNYRVVTGANDANALPSSSITTSNDPRQDVNTSANPFSSSFGNNLTEGGAPSKLRLQLQSIPVRANPKKLEAQWSIEEMQDLRAYHNLDAAQELMGSLAREMAIEWNATVLNDMLVQATGSSRVYGTTTPGTAFTQDKWDAYIWTYIQALDSDIFKKRNGPLTHIVVGADAAIYLGKTLQYAASASALAGGGGDTHLNMELYPGTTFFPSIITPSGSPLKIIKNNFWTGANGFKILGLRRGTDWSDTPYVFSPYADYVTPQFTNPGDFTQQQGILSRAANQVVVGDAMGVLSINNSGTGAGVGVPL